MRRVAEFLRSPRLAVWLFGLVIGYSALGTLVPQGASGDAAVAGWVSRYPGPAGVAAALGLHQAFRTPVFLALAVLLACSTAVCAWDRTGASLKALRGRPTSPEFLRRLRERPPIVVAVASRTRAAEVVARAVKSQRLHLTANGDFVEARSTSTGRLGSPLFHWSLALLFVVIPLGQLTRAEGVVDVVEGTSIPDLASSYGRLEKGPWHGGMSGRIIAVPRIARTFIASGIQQGVTPFVELRSSRGDVLASGFIYPNHLVSYASTVVHSSSNGLAVVARISQGSESVSREILLALDDTSPTGVIPAELTLSDPNGSPMAELRVDLPPTVSAPATPTIVVSVAPPGGRFDSPESSTTALAQGGSVGLPTGLTFTAERLTRYVRLAVVDDWSVSVMYWLFGTAIVGLSLALLSPIRKVWLLVVEDDAGTRIHAAALHGRADPAFASRIEAALLADLGADAGSR